MSAASFAALRLRDVLHAARERKASDAHLVPGLPPVLRVDGVLEPLPGSPLRPQELRELAGEVLGVSCEDASDVSTAWNDGELGVMRVHVFRGDGACAIAIRLLGDGVPSLESLELPETIGSFAERSHGLVLFTGPTGSGKSTTMAAFVDRINRTRALRIVTIEDPIEYRHASKRCAITQREVGRDCPDLAAALRGALRSDPDVIVVGEMRDGAGIAGALTAAETGHLVVATLHTGDCAQTIDRIVDAFEGAAQAQVRAQLAQSLVAVVSQRLVRRPCGAGRRAAVEILVATDAARSLIREGRSYQLRNAIATGRQYGMLALEQHLREIGAGA